MKPIQTIDHFNGQYAFLSNFAPTNVLYDNLEYFTVEHAYQAAKTLDLTERKKIQGAETPAVAKKMGRNVILRNDWESVKLDIMLDLLRQKFLNDDLKYALLSTNNAELIEGNWWGDVFWGVCRGRGQNHLGRLLMLVRNEICQ